MPRLLRRLAADLLTLASVALVCAAPYLIISLYDLAGWFEPGP